MTEHQNSGTGSGERVLFDGQPVLRFRDDNLRRNFLKVAAVVGVGSTLAAATHRERTAGAEPTANDLEILNYALTLEYLEAEFYTKGIKEGAVSDRELELVEPIRDHENEHVAVVKQTIKDLGGKAVSKPEFSFPDGTFSDRETFLTTAATFEELGVTAYHGQVARVDDADILKAAASIAGVESRHAAVIAHLIDENPFPSPFEKRMTMKQVLKAADKFIK
ncbi:ferritin-like domain-containing protein [Microlunatus speluncae]|uniref:ferritin-like domain-containing protein n=1 Tax=Microlunatus speluncae TaxID=2594267 RepID=UPI0012667862|nr:ferritin-like domain-containing protein [Microlunatus speluncae]